MASISKTIRPKRSNNASVSPTGYGLTVGRGTPTASGTSSSRYPNEPAGYARVFEHDFQAVPSGSNGIAGSWILDMGASELSVATDATAPFIDTNVMRTRFANGMSSGVAPCTVQVDATGNTGRRDEQYFSMLIKVEGSDYENQSIGTKIGFLGYAQSDTGALNQGYLFLQGNGSQTPDNSWPLQFRQQNVADRDISRNVGSGDLLFANTWHQIEAVMVLNTVGSSNGELYIWVDDALAFSYTDILYRDAGNAMGFRSWKWNPTWGGAGGTKTRNDYISLAHVYLSGSGSV